MNANPSAAATALARRGAVDQAYRLLRSAIAAGDAEAAATLAEWRLSGTLIRRDLAEARELYGQAAALGLEDAAPVHLALLANGAGGSGRDWPRALALLPARAVRNPAAREQLALLQAMALDEAGNPAAKFVPLIRSRNPRIETLAGFLSPGECDYLIRLASPQFQPAVVVHPQTGQFVRDPVRRASSAAFPFVAEDPVLHAINRRIAAATGTAYEQGEPLQVLAYGPGDEYKLHSDALPAPVANQRVATVLVALNAGYAGGETDFPRVPLRWRGSVGEALHFRSIDARGAPDPRGWHAGLPVTRGRKLILSKWLRERPLDLTGPPGKPF